MPTIDTGKQAIDRVFKRLRKEGYYCKQRETDYEYKRWTNGSPYKYCKFTNNEGYRKFLKQVTPEKYVFYKNTNVWHLRSGVGIVAIAYAGDLEELKAIFESEGFTVRKPSTMLDSDKAKGYKYPFYIQYKQAV